MLSSPIRYSEHHTFCGVMRGHLNFERMTENEKRKRDEPHPHTHAQMTGAENRTSRRPIENPHEPSPSIHPLAPALQAFHLTLFPVGHLISES